MSETEPVNVPDESMEANEDVETDPVDAVLAEESGLGDADGEEGDGADGEGQEEMAEGGEEDGEKKEDGEEGDKGEKKERILMDPSKGFLENEQDKMIAATWQYRIKLLAMNYKTREMNHENIEKLVNISQNAAMYYKFGKLELMLASQVTGQLAMEKILKMNIPSKPLSLYLMRKNEETEEVAFMKLLPRTSHQINFPKGQTSEQLGGNAQNRSVYVSNIPEGTSDELLQVLFPCSVSITKPEDKEAGTVLVECIDSHSARCMMRSFLKVQISHNVLALTSAGDDKEDGDDKDDKDRDARRSSGYKKQNKLGKRTASFQPYPRGGRGARSRGRGFPPGPYMRGGYGGGGDPALHQQIAMLQQNISMLTQAVNPMMMRGGGGGRGGGMGRGGGYSGGASRPNKRRRQFSGQGSYGSGDNYNGDSYTTSRSSYGSSGYGGGMQSSGYSSSGGYGSGSQYGSGMGGGSGGSGSWGSGTSGSSYSQSGNPRKRSYAWDDSDCDRGCEFPLGLG